MAWLKLISKEIFREKLTWIYAGLLVLVMVGLGVYNYHHPDETIVSIENRISNYEFNLSQAISHIRNMQLYDETYDSEDLFFNALNQQSEYIKAWKQDMQEGQHLPIYENKLMEYILNQDIDVLRNGPLRMEVDETAQERYLITSYMIDHNIPYMEESYPVNSALFTLQNIPLILSLFTAVLVIITFGLSIYQDLENHKLDYFMTLPQSPHLSMSKYTFQILQIILITLFIFSLSLLPMLIQGNSLSLLYPYLISIFDKQLVLPVWQVILLSMTAWIIGVLSLHIFSIFCMILSKSLEYVIMAVVLIVLISIPILKGNQLQIWHPLSLLAQLDLLLLHSTRTLSHL